MSTEDRPTRRTALKTILLVSCGLGLAAVGAGEFESTWRKSVASQGKPITIKVVYVGMSTQMSGGIKQEYLSLPPPVHLDDVLNQIKEQHTIVPTMIQTMQIVVNGVPTQDNPLLSDNTEVDLIPLYAGG